MFENNRIINQLCDVENSPDFIKTLFLHMDYPTFNIEAIYYLISLNSRTDFTKMSVWGCFSFDEPSRCRLIDIKPFQQGSLTI